MPLDTVTHPHTCGDHSYWCLREALVSESGKNKLGVGLGRVCWSMLNKKATTSVKYIFQSRIDQCIKMFTFRRNEMSSILCFGGLPI